MSVVCTALSAVTGMGQAVTAPRQVIRSTCLVKVSQDNLTEIVGHLAGTADVAGRAAKGIFGSDESIAMGYQVVSVGVVQLTAELPAQSAGNASAFWKAVGENLQKAMTQVNEQQVEQVDIQISVAERRKAEALAKLQPSPSTSHADKAVQEQLDKMVDLSTLKRDMPLDVAIDVLKKSVNPPLTVTVVWQDLDYECKTDAGTPIGVDGVSPMKLETALRLVLKLISNRGSGGECQIDYAVDNGVVIIASKKTLRSLVKGAAEGPWPQLSAEELATHRQGLINQLQEAEMDSLRLQARRKAMEEQAAELRRRIDQTLDQDALIRELQKLVDMMAQAQTRVQALIEQGAVPQGQMGEAVERLVKAKIDLARQREAAAQAAGGEQLAKLMAGLSELAVQAAEKEAILPILHDQLGRLEAQLEQAQSSIPKAIERDLALRSLKQAEERIQDLRQSLSSLQQPTITVIGAGS
jgi:hypothetical protein